MLEKIRVGVLRGGISPEYDVSLKTGGAVLEHLPKEKYQPIDILLTKDGTWHIGGLPAPLPKIAKKVDVVFNALHGKYGEDGKVPQLLEHFKILYTGSQVLPSALGMNKALAKERFKRFGLRTPGYIVIKNNRIREGVLHPRSFQTLVFGILEQIPTPLIVKPVSGGSSFSTFLIRTEKELPEVLLNLSEKDDDILFEEFIAGKEATCGVIDNFRGQETYTLLPVEIRLGDEHCFFDHVAKYQDRSGYVIPGNFNAQESAVIQNMARRAHRALELRQYSRSDFIVTPRGIFILETNSLPTLTAGSTIVASLLAVGSSLSEFLDHVIMTTLTE